MDNLDLARRFIAAQEYLQQFRKHNSLPGTISLAPSEMARIGAALDGLEKSGLIPKAELVTVAIVFESIDNQPADVRAVLGRIVTEWEKLAGDTERLRAVAACRQKHFPGILER